MKILWKIFKIFLWSLLALLILLILSFFVLWILVTDKDYVEPSYLKKSEVEDIDINRIFANSMFYTADSGKLDITLSEKELSIIAHSYILEINKELPNDIKIKTAFAKIVDEDTVMLNVYFKAFFVNSSFKLTFDYEIVGNKVILTMNKVKIGKLKVWNKLISTISDSLNLEKDVNKELENKGLELDISDKGVTATLDLEILRTEILKDRNDSEILNTFTSLVFRTKNIFAANNQDDMFGFVVDLEKFSSASNSNIVRTEVDYEIVASKIETLLNEEIIRQEEVDIFSAFIVYGFNRMNTTNKGIVLGKDLSSIGIYNNEKYLGMFDKYQFSVRDIFINQTNYFEGFKLTETEINKVLGSNDVYSASYFVNKVGKRYDVSYLSLESIYVDVNSSLDFYVVLSVNGYRIELVINTTTGNTSSLKSELIIESINIGEVELNEEEKYEIINLINKNTAESWIDFSIDKIDIDFQDMFKSSPTLSSFVDIYPLTVYYVNNGEGYILIQ